MLEFRAGEILTAGKLNALNEDDTWTPTLTGSSVNPTLGTGSTIEGEVHWNGQFFLARFNITFGTSGAAAGTGTYQIDLPADMAMAAGWATNVSVGEAEVNDGGTAYPMTVRTSSGTRLILRHNGDATHGNSAWASTTVPMGNNDFVRGSFQALAAALP